MSWLLPVVLACTERSSPELRVAADPSALPLEVLPPAGPQPPVSGRPKNVLMLSIDTLRVDHLVHMPFLKGRIDSGLRALDFQQCSNWTFGSVPCTLSGLDPVDAGWVANIRQAEREPLPAEVDTLAEHLAAAGYDTVLVSSNTWLGPTWDTDQGYRVTEGAGPRAIDSFTRGLDAVVGDGPWLVHVHLADPHVPYDPPEEYLAGIEDLPPVTWDLSTDAIYDDVLNVWDDIPPEEQEAVEAHLRLRYAGEVAWLDDQLAEAFADLEAQGWLDEALVVLWTDHGEQFWERGHATHAWNLGPEENDALFALWGEGVGRAAVIDGPVHGTDVLPTVLGRLGLPIPVALPGVVLGAAPADRQRFAYTTGRAGTLISITQGDFELVYGFDGSLSLYDRAADPLELVDVYDPLHPEVPALWDALSARAEALSALVPAEPPVWP